MPYCSSTFLTYCRNISPPEGLGGTGAAAETLSAKRGDWTLRRGQELFSHLRAMVFERVLMHHFGKQATETGHN
jgi:hypothetical protein